MNLHIDIENSEQVSTIYLSGEVDAYTAPKLKEAIIPLTRKEGANIKVDLAKVTYMDSTGLGVFISALKSTKEHDSHLALTNLQERVYRLFDITGLKEVIRIENFNRGGK
ncbi:STAS domain-containing protein [Salirhabdus salicampi]|uniref:STAS domain-containing protein n=1 Tax=Salirhabdus salicampi TaxID=476102 RepID=UPI0020C2AE5C|nr:STAS domain-containing protein [Salirhabdus salicampi]MCP8618085.1 STAS domain-containing protein [Salirhabdus salicampi]